jgi:hypothetical protein
MNREKFNKKIVDEGNRKKFQKRFFYTFFKKEQKTENVFGSSGTFLMI